MHRSVHSHGRIKRGLGFWIVRRNVALIFSQSQEKHDVGVNLAVRFWKITASKPLVHSRSFIAAKILQHLSRAQSGVAVSLLARDSLSDPHSCVVVKQGLHSLQTSLWLPSV